MLFCLHVVVCWSIVKVNPLNRTGDTMTRTKFIQHQMIVRAGLTAVVNETHDLREEYHAHTNTGRIFVVLSSSPVNVKAQIDVIAQLDQIMNNTSIKRA